MLPWIERHETYYVEVDGVGYFRCKHCEFELQIIPEYEKIQDGPDDVYHCGSTGGLEISVEVTNGKLSS